MKKHAAPMALSERPTSPPLGSETWRWSAGRRHGSMNTPTALVLSATSGSTRLQIFLWEYYNIYLSLKQQHPQFHACIPYKPQPAYLQHLY
ncbi:hypothetical protein OPV22_006833 [Ensete ventricosum]|uniref:Uncharacterized protein n=1 Tax=Ensete ventricosum TaxID=4639 RepID=A0AAV8Q5C7_ENSVE|nr:hypothetical protein OPV22_006833 [Ensete ventricosum]